MRKIRNFFFGGVSHTKSRLDTCLNWTLAFPDCKRSEQKGNRLLDKAWPRIYEELGIAVESDPRDGLAVGGYTNLINVDLKSHTRSYAATAYYLPVAERPNLKVVTRALVEKILLKKGRGRGDGNWSAIFDCEYDFSQRSGQEGSHTLRGVNWVSSDSGVVGGLGIRRY